MTRIFRNVRDPRKAYALRASIVLVLLGLVMGATYTFTASNTVNGSNAGSGGGAISGYTVNSSSIHYTVNSSNPQNLDRVDFTLNTSASSAWVQVNGSTWYSCTISGGTSVQCNTTAPSQATVAAANTLTVVAAQ
jgi:hypothetical protein